MQRITPFLWVDDQAEQATNFYVSIFPHSKILSRSHYGEAGPKPGGTVMVVEFELDGQKFMALNGGPEFKFNESVSFMVECKTQEELDGYREKLLSDGGTPVQCGWLKDKYGLAWQVVPAALMEMLKDKDAERVNRVMQAMLEMVRIDLRTIKEAYEHAPAAR